MVSLRRLAAALVLISLLICLASETPAAEPLEIVVTGLTDDVLKNVREMLTLPYGLVQNGKVDRLWLERFRNQAEEKVRTALEPFGYYNARVTVTLAEVGPEKYRLLVDVATGVPVVVAEVNLVLQGPGSAEAALKQRLAVFPLAKGSVLLQQRYEQAKEELLTQAHDLGYLEADFSVHEIHIDKPKATARIALVLETGGRFFFDGVKITGAPDYPETFLRRYLAFKPGDFFSYTRLGETQSNFINSERFKEISITPEKPAAGEDRIPVEVDLKPGPTRNLRQGIGYGTDTGARLTARYRDLNIGDRGHEFFTNLFISEHLKGLATGYIIPDSNDLKSSTSLQLNLQEQDVTTYLSRLVSLELNRNRSFGDGRTGTAYIRLQREVYTIGAQDSSEARLVLPGLRFSGGRYDNPTRPSRGFHYGFDIRGTHRYLGSDMGLLQAISGGSYLLPLPLQLSLYLRANTGITVLSDPLSDLPPSLRFFAGGDQSVRGYSYQSLGPKDATGRVVGGKHLLVGSVELTRALFKFWGTSIFYDAGNAFDSFTAISLFQGAGVGVHYYTPVGALNFYVARQVNVEEPNFHVHFTVGFEL